MRKLLLIALFGATCIATPALAQDQGPLTLRDVYVQAIAQAPPAPARPATVPAAPAAARPAPVPAPAAPPAVPAPQPAPAPPGTIAPVRANQPTPNIRFDITITDTGGAKPVTKALSLNVSPGSNGSIRNSARIPGGGFVASDDGKSSVPASIVLNVDVRQVQMVDNNAIRATVSVEYQPYVPDAKSQPGVISASSGSVLVDGRKMQILVASDPVSDRRTTIEVTATILK